MNNVILFNIKSALGSFQRPQSNNNSSTFYIMPKSTLIGIICGVIGLNREFMKENNLYKILTEKLLYSIRLCSPFQIKTWSEYKYNHGNVDKPNQANYTPAKFERLVNVNYNVYLMYDDNDNDLNLLLSNFIRNIKANEFIFPPYMGMSNFLAEIKYLDEFKPKNYNGKFITHNICTNIVLNESQPFINIRTDDIPTRNISYLAYDSNSYKTIYFHDNCGTIEAEGNYFLIGNDAVEFI